MADRAMLNKIIFIKFITTCYFWSSSCQYWVLWFYRNYTKCPVYHIRRIVL